MILGVWNGLWLSVMEKELEKSIYYLFLGGMLMAWYF